MTAFSSAKGELAHLQKFLAEHNVSDISPDPKCVDMIKYYQQAKRDHNFQLIESIRRNKEFGNPYILTKVVEHFNIDQSSTNFSKERFDPKEYTPEEFEASLKRRRVDPPASAVAHVPVQQAAVGTAVPVQSQQQQQVQSASTAAAIAAAIAHINSTVNVNVSAPAPGQQSQNPDQRRKTKWG